MRGYSDAKHDGNVAGEAETLRRHFGQNYYGNSAGNTSRTISRSANKVSKGRHVIAVMQKPGARNWQMSSVGGFSEKSADEMPGFRVPARPLPPRDLRLNPSFREIPLPLAMETAWRERATRNRDRLQSVVRDLPGTEEAATAAAILSSL